MTPTTPGAALVERVAPPRRPGVCDPRAAKAQRMVRDAIKRGLLVRPLRCSQCASPATFNKSGRSSIQGHHEDYGRPLDVVWLCIPCHRSITPLPERPGAPVFGDRNGMRTMPWRRARGERQGSSRLNEAQVCEILLRRADTDMHTLAARFGVSIGTVKDIWYRRSWRWLASPLAAAAKEGGE